jgi:hypothetical protein
VDQGEDDQGDGGHPGLLVGDASQDGIQSQKIPLGHDVRRGGEWVGVDGVVRVAKGKSKLKMAIEVTRVDGG